jgi:hypothetical protein
MYGYRPGEQTRLAAARFASEDTWQYMQQPDFRYRFDGRWVVAAAVNTSIRGLLRRDLTLTRAMQDLYYPRSYQKKVSPEAFEHLMATFRPRRDRLGLRVGRRTTEFLAYVNDAHRANGIRMVLLILPQHPRLRSYLGEEYYRQLDEYLAMLRREHNLAVISCVDLLSEEQFVDPTHPDAVGAEMLTDFVASELKTSDICSSIRASSLSFR